jgi:hypothetical protein
MTGTLLRTFDLISVQECLLGEGKDKDKEAATNQGSGQSVDRN